MTDRVNDSTTLVQLAAILSELGASIAVDLTGRSVLVTLTCPLSASAASASTMPEAIDRAIGRLKESRNLQAQYGAPGPADVAPIALQQNQPNQLHPTAVRCWVCGARAAEAIAGQPETVRPAFSAVRGGSLVQLCNTLVTGPMLLVDGREYHEARVIEARRIAAEHAIAGSPS